jgi:predicted lipoprotein with Yx(FWY)xxD motif
MRTNFRRALLPAVASTIMFAAACGGSSSSKSTPTAATTTVATLGATSVAAAGSPTSAATTAAPTSAATTAAPTSAAATAAPTSAATTAAPTAAAAPTVKIGDSSRGKVLTDTRGLTLYTFSGDVAGSGNSAVSGGLLVAWPAFTIPGGNPVKPDGLTDDLATITRSDGSKQVTYKGLPLYFWQNDKAPGDVTGQGIAGFTVAAP